VLNAFAVLLCLSATLAWFTSRFLRIPTTVGVTLSAAVAAMLIVAVDSVVGSFGLRAQAEALLLTLDFTTFVLNGILSILLFAGALSLDARLIVEQRASILTLASVGTLVSTGLIGAGAYVVFQLVGLPMPFVWALLFGALISPTDPVAVLDLLKRAKVPARLEALVAGESLFNDGVGVVLYLVVGSVAGAALGEHAADPTLAGAVLLFVREAIGGLAFGAALGWLGYQACRSIDGHAVETLITLAIVVGGYLCADALGVSGPLAMVVAGLAISYWRERAFDEATRHHVEGFWETLDQVLNILLFAFIGFDVLLAPTTGPQLAASAALIGVALAARLVSVWLPMRVLLRDAGHGRYTVRLLTWGGLRGGIAISLALGLPMSPYRSTLVTATYAVVLFSIAVQGLTVMPLVRKVAAASPH
jgi:CPA1 family monovalent cation:H+ antiporter